MNAYATVLLANFVLYGVQYLFFWILLQLPEMSVFFVGAQAIMNLLAAALNFVDKQKALGRAFLIGFAISAAIAVVGFYILYVDPEMITGPIYR